MKKDEQCLIVNIVHSVRLISSVVNCTMPLKVVNCTSLVSWSSRKQSSVAQSTVEADLVAKFFG